MPSQLLARRPDSVPDTRKKTDRMGGPIRVARRLEIGKGRGLRTNPSSESTALRNGPFGTGGGGGTVMRIKLLKGEGSGVDSVTV